MPQRSAVSQLPEGVRKELEQRLIKGGFSDYDGLADWLGEQGFEISRSSVHRYGQQFENRLQALKLATDQAKAIASASKDDEGDMNEALIRLVQTKTFEILVAFEEGEDENGKPTNVDLSKIGRMVAELARASISQKKHADEIRRAEREAAANDVEEAARAQGMDDDQVLFWRGKVLGIG